MSTIIKDIILPDFPSNFFDNIHKYGIALCSYKNGEPHIIGLIATDTPIYCASGELANIPSNYKVLFSNCSTRHETAIPLYEENGVWSEITVKEEPFEEAIGTSTADMYVELIWSNHNINWVTNINADGSYEISEEIYFVGHEKAYTMPSTWFEDLGDTTRKIFGVSDELTPIQIEEKLSELYSVEGLVF